MPNAAGARRGSTTALRLEHLQASDASEIECPNCRKQGLVAPHRLHDRFAVLVVPLGVVYERRSSERARS
jgi:hypothetical protein